MLKNISRVSVAHVFTINNDVCGDFLKISDHFPKICPKARRTFPNIFGKLPKITEDCRRRPKKIQRCFDHTPTNLGVVKGIKKNVIINDIFTCEDIVSFLSTFIRSPFHESLVFSCYTGEPLRECVYLEKKLKVLHN